MIAFGLLANEPFIVVNSVKGCIRLNADNCLEPRERPIFFKFKCSQKQHHFLLVSTNTNMPVMSYFGLNLDTTVAFKLKYS